ncbi:hypothetical protein ACSBR2_005451 [Camellia fascicularis]
MGMEFAVLLLCTFRQTNAVFRLNQALTLRQLVHGVCEKFDGLDLALVYFFFIIPGYSKFKVDCDDDVQNMLSLAKSFGLDHMDVLIQIRSYGSGVECDTSWSPNVGVCDTMDGPTCNIEDRADLLSSYYPYKLKTFLSAGWAFGITHVGQSFGDGANEFRTILCKYTVECGFQFKYVKNDSVRITALCKFATSSGCVWLVHAKVSASNGVLSLKRFNSVHSCGAAIRTYKNPRTGSELVSDVITNHVRAQPLTHPMDVVFDMKDSYELDISYHVTWLGVEKVMGDVFGNHAKS